MSLLNSAPINNEINYDAYYNANYYQDPMSLSHDGNRPLLKKKELICDSLNGENNLYDLNPQFAPNTNNRYYNDNQFNNYQSVQNMNNMYNIPNMNMPNLQSIPNMKNLQNMNIPNIQNMQNIPNMQNMNIPNMQNINIPNILNIPNIQNTSKENFLPERFIIPPQQKVDFPTIISEEKDIKHTPIENIKKNIKPKKYEKYENEEKKRKDEKNMKKKKFFNNKMLWNIIIVLLLIIFLFIIKLIIDNKSLIKKMFIKHYSYEM